MPTPLLHGIYFEIVTLVNQKKSGNLKFSFNKIWVAITEVFSSSDQKHKLQKTRLANKNLVYRNKFCNFTILAALITLCLRHQS